MRKIVINICMSVIVIMSLITLTGCTQKNENEKVSDNIESQVVKDSSIFEGMYIPEEKEKTGVNYLMVAHDGDNHIVVTEDNGGQAADCATKDKVSGTTINSEIYDSNYVLRDDNDDIYFNCSRFTLEDTKFVISTGKFDGVYTNDSGCIGIYTIDANKIGVVYSLNDASLSGSIILENPVIDGNTVSGIENKKNANITIEINKDVMKFKTDSASVVWKNSSGEYYK